MTEANIPMKVWEPGLFQHATRGKVRLAETIHEFGFRSDALLLVSEQRAPRVSLFTIS